MLDERLPLPESVGALTHIALRGYRRRFLLYFGTAFAGLLFEAGIAYLRPGDIGFFYAGSIVVDALLAALVTIGVVADLRDGDRPTNGAVAGRAFGRWGIVAAVTTLVDVVTFFSSNAVFGPPESTAYGLLSLPIIVLWGSVAFASVIAAIDEKTAPATLVLSSIGRSIGLAFARQNFGRLTLLAIVAVVPMLIEAVLSDQLEMRKVAAWQFIANIPIDALVTGPLQAVFTVFYLDFVRRTSGPRPT
ncbi:MAG: hypothetical protein ABSB70_15815 [Candidatus Velthaea sp.]|jgi:hypothetical protein